jgi:hypothetical protein
MPVLYFEIFGSSVVIFISYKLLLYNMLPLDELAYPSFLCESYSDPCSGSTLRSIDGAWSRVIKAR